MEELWRSCGGVVEELFRIVGWRNVLEAPRAVQERSGDDFWRLKSARDAILGVLGAPRGDFWRLKSALDPILGVLGAPRGCLEASVWDFGAF